MRQRFLFGILICAITIVAQEKAPDLKIVDLKHKISQSAGGERLYWMDSLSSYKISESNFKNDSVLIKTVQFATELDSMNIAARQTANLIYIENNIIGNPAEGIRLFVNFLEHIQDVTNHNILAKLYIEGADSYFFMEDFIKSVEFYNLAIKHAEIAQNKKYIGIAKLYKGGTLSALGNFPEASMVLQEASKMFQETQDTFHIIGAKNSLSILYSQNSFFEEAKTEREEAIALAKMIESYAHLVSFYYNAATDADKNDNDKERIEKLKLAFESSKKTTNPDFYKINILTSLTIAYAEVDSIHLAEMNLSEIQNSVDKHKSEMNRARYLEALKSVAFAKGEYENALKYGIEHLELKRSGASYEEIQAAEKFMADVYERIGNNNKAFEHFKNYSALKDSISNVQKVKTLSYYQTIYETEKRDATIKAQQKDIDLLDARSEVKSQWLIFGGLGLLGLFGSVILMRSRNAAKRRQRLQEKFSQDLIKTQEEERTRLARELHDSVGQKLMLITKKTKGKGDFELEFLAENTLGELRTVSRGLHPSILKRLGVTAAIQSLIDEIDASTTILFSHEIDAIDSLLPNEKELHLYRIIQELLNNMIKHSEAKAASIKISANKTTINAVIKDNGKGFDFTEKLNSTTSLGMKTILERAKIMRSQIEIISNNNSGTKVTLNIPI